MDRSAALDKFATPENETRIAPAVVAAAGVVVLLMMLGILYQLALFLL